MAYFFNNIENVFELKKQQHFNLFGGNEYVDEKQKLKDWKYNYHTQPSFGNEYCQYKKRTLAKRRTEPLSLGSEELKIIDSMPNSRMASPQISHRASTSISEEQKQKMIQI